MRNEFNNSSRVLAVFITALVLLGGCRRSPSPVVVNAPADPAPPAAAAPAPAASAAARPVISQPLPASSPARDQGAYGNASLDKLGRYKGWVKALLDGTPAEKNAVRQGYGALSAGDKKEFENYCRSCAVKFP